MTRTTRVWAGAVAVFLALAASASAQGQDDVGQWACQMAYAEYNQQGYLQGHDQHYTMVLYPDGQYQAAGYTQSGTVVEQFQAQGQWQFNPANGELSGQGTSVTEYGLQLPFPILGTISSDGMTLHKTEDTPDSTNSYIAQRVALMCQRQG